MTAFIEKLSELERIAKAATPGPWAYGDWSGQCKMKHIHGSQCHYEYVLHEGRGTNIVLKHEPITLVTSTSEYCEFSDKNARHVSTFNPEECLHLLSALRTAYEALEKIRRENISLCSNDVSDDAIVEIDKLFNKFP